MTYIPVYLLPYHENYRDTVRFSARVERMIGFKRDREWLVGPHSSEVRGWWAISAVLWNHIETPEHAVRALVMTDE